MRSSQRPATAGGDGLERRSRNGGPGPAEGSLDQARDPASIVIIDDHLEVLVHLRAIIAQEPDLAVVATCRCADGAMLAVQRYLPAVVVLDVRLSDRDGIELIRDIIAISDAKVIVFTAAAQKAEIISALRNGAKAIVFKTQPAPMLISCIRKVLAGEPCVIPWQVMTSGRQRANGYGALENLSPREREVAQWAAAGARNKEIAWQLAISEGTVKLHLFHAYRKLGVSNRVGLARALGSAGSKILTALSAITFVY
jgi:DNA-binding NarL/FixJ family response regulator